MREVFATVLNNAWVAGIMIIALMLIRLVMRKMPKFIYPVLWGIVGLKLLILTDIHSWFGMLPNEKTIEYTSREQAPVIIRTGLNQVDDGVNSLVVNNTNNSSASVSGWNYYDAGMHIWIIGIMLLFLYMIISYIMVRKVTSQSIYIEEGVKICDGIKSPFLFGIIKPQIFLPSDIAKDKYDYILAHEKMHIKRGDHLWKALGFVLLCIYWFNPLCWAAYYLFCKDVEFACDEKVISRQDPLWRANYCQTLLECSTDRRKVIFVPLGFGEVGVKERVKKVMVYKKTKIGIAIVLIFICTIILICVGTRQNASSTANNSGEKKENLTNESTGQDEVVGQKPTIDISDFEGADGTHLYYADESKMIFGGYYGLFVYDTQNHKYIQSVDLKSVGCEKTQGDDFCDIKVNKDGTTVYLHVMSDSDNMYEYSVENNLFVKKKYDIGESDLYNGITDENGYEEAKFTTKAGQENSYMLVNEYSGTLGELGYKRYEPNADYDLVYPLFVENGMENAGYFNSSDVYDIVRADINYDGKHYVCEDKKVLADIQNGYANAKKGEGMSACPFTYVMYLTRADGTIGLVIPAMDDCKACIMGDGWYEQDDSISMSIYDMIKKGMFQVE